MSNIAATVFDGMVATTPSDAANDPAGPFAALWIGTAGTLKFIDSMGNTVTIATSVPVGLFPVRCVRVFATGTAAVVFGLKAVP